MASEGVVRITDIISRTYNVKSFRAQPLPGVSYQAGQFLSVRLGPGKEHKHWLSFSSSPTEEGFIEFTKKLSESEFSQRLSQLKVGDTVEVQYPFGAFMLRPADKRVAFLSGGIGITPIHSICKYVFDRKLDVDMNLVYANRSVKDIVFKDDFDRMEKDSPHVRVSHVLCEFAPGFKCTVGLINSRVLRNEIPDYAERAFFLCGPPAMVEAMKVILSQELGVAQEQIITENFVGY